MAIPKIIDLINNDTTTIEIDNNGVIEKQSVRDEAFNKVVLNNELLKTFYTIYVKESMKSIHHNGKNEYKAFKATSNTFFNPDKINRFEYKFTNENIEKDNFLKIKTTFCDV